MVLLKTLELLQQISLISFTIYYEEDIDDSVLEIRYSETTFQSTISETLDTSDNIEIDNTNILLSELTGNWFEVTETITYGFEDVGSYQVYITNIETDEVLMDYSYNTRNYYKTNADFLRPKWGIYRSTEDDEDLKDEEVLYADFSITEWSDDSLSNENFEELEKFPFSPNPCKNIIYFPFLFNTEGDFKVEIINTNGRIVISKKLISDHLLVSRLGIGLYFLKITNTTTNAYSINKIIKM